MLHRRSFNAQLVSFLQIAKAARVARVDQFRAVDALLATYPAVLVAMNGQRVLQADSADHRILFVDRDCVSQTTKETEEGNLTEDVIKTFFVYSDDPRVRIKFKGAALRRSVVCFRYGGGGGGGGATTAAGAGAVRTPPTPAKLLGAVQRNVRRLVRNTPFDVTEASRETQLGFLLVGLCLFHVGHDVDKILSYCLLFFFHSSPLPLLQRHRRRSRRLLRRRLFNLAQLLLHSLLLLLHLRLQLQQLAFVGFEPEGAEDEKTADHE